MIFAEYVEKLAEVKQAYKEGNSLAENEALKLRVEAYKSGYDLYRMEVLANEKVNPGTATNWEWAFGTICRAAMMAENEKEAAE